MCRKLEASNVRFVPTRPSSKGLIGFASLDFNQSLALHNIAVYTRPDGNGVRLVFPQQKLPNGFVVNLFHPITHAATEAMTQAVMVKVEELQGKNPDILERADEPQAKEECKQLLFPFMAEDKLRKKRPRVGQKGEQSGS